MIKETLTKINLIMNNMESLIKINSKKYHVGAKDLLTQVLLHIPKLTNYQLRDPTTVNAEIARLANIIHQARSEYEYLEKHPRSFKFDKLHAEWVEDDLARIIHEKFHYIMRFRQNSSHVGIFLSDSGEKRLAGLITFSDFDQEHIEKYLPIDIEKNQVKILSRMYSFDWVPKNFSSHMIGKSLRMIKNHYTDTKMLLTYLNLNLKFEGTSYKASNWKLFAKEQIQKYAYLDDNYVTLRSLIEDFCLTRLDLLQEKLGNRLQFSLQPLEPLQIYEYVLDKRIKIHGTSNNVVHVIKKNIPIA